MDYLEDDHMIPIILALILSGISISMGSNSLPIAGQDNNFTLSFSNASGSLTPVLFFVTTYDNDGKILSQTNIINCTGKSTMHLLVDKPGTYGVRIDVLEPVKTDFETVVDVKGTVTVPEWGSSLLVATITFIAIITMTRIVRK
jgi:hypothetical protein